MKLKNVFSASAVPVLLLLACFQRAEADTVQAIVSAVVPDNNQQFYLTSPSPNASMSVAGGAGYRAISKNTDTIGTPAKSVEIKCDYTLTHAISVGMAHTESTDDSFTMMPGQEQEIDHEQDATGDFEADVYTTTAFIGMHAITTATTFTTSSSGSHNWTVNPYLTIFPMGSTGSPRNGTSQSQRIALKKSSRHPRTASHITF